MLYDSKRAGIYSTENFAAWLGQQPRSRTYRYTDGHKCAAAQYLKAHGVEQFVLDPSDLRALGWDEIVNMPHDNTFGGAYRRARLVLRNDWLTHLARLFGNL
jgi:hypothetical protein